jgi:hypothetical protein
MARGAGSLEGRQEPGQLPGLSRWPPPGGGIAGRAAAGTLLPGAGPRSGC